MPEITIGMNEECYHDIMDTVDQIAVWDPTLGENNSLLMLLLRGIEDWQEAGLHKETAADA